MKPYKTNQGDLSIIIAYINDGLEIRLLMYKINIESISNLLELINESTTKVINTYGKSDLVFNNGISCELIMIFTGFTNQLLICFVIEQTTPTSIVASIFNPENNLSQFFFLII